MSSTTTEGSVFNEILFINCVKIGIVCVKCKRFLRGNVTYSTNNPSQYLFCFFSTNHLYSTEHTNEIKIISPHAICFHFSFGLANTIVTKKSIHIETNNKPGRLNISFTQPRNDEWKWSDTRIYENLKMQSDWRNQLLERMGIWFEESSNRLQR